MPSDQRRRTVHRRSRRVARPLAFAGVAVLALTSIGGAATANAAPASPGVASLYSGQATFGVGGHHWVMTIDAGAGLTAINIATGGESDLWTFLSEPFTVNNRTGDATLISRNTFAPVAFVNLRFTAGKRTKEPCRAGSETSFSGKLTGSVTLVANTKGLKFKSAHVSFRSPSLTIDNNCTMPTSLPPCASGSWGIGTVGISAGGTTPGLPGRQAYSVDVLESFTLSQPVDTFLSVNLLGRARKPVFDTKNKTLRVAASGAGGITGSADLKATQRTGVKLGRCALNGEHFQSRDTFYAATWVSPKGGQFQARSLVVGRIKVERTGAGANFDIVTIRRA